VIRTLHKITGIHAKTLELQYQITDVNQVVAYGDDSLALVGGLAVASTFLGSYDPRCFLFGFDPNSGEIAWQNRVHWTKMSSGKFGGFSATESFIHLTEQAVSIPRLVWLDPLTGEKVHEMESLATQSAPLASGDFLFLDGGRHGGLCRVPREPGAGPVETVLDVNLRTLAAEGDHVFVLHKAKGEDQYQMTAASIQANTGEILSQFPLDPDIDTFRARFYTYGHPDRAIMYGHDNRLFVLDFQQEKILWALALPYHRYTDLAITPWGVMASFGLNAPSVLIDPESGEMTDMTFFERDPDNILALDGHLLAAQGFSTEVWTPERVEGIPSFVDTSTLPAVRIDTVVHNDAPIDPREQLQEAFGAAARLGKLDPALEKIREIFPISRISGKVKTFLEATLKGEIPKGPLNFVSWDELAYHCFRYEDLFRFGGKDRFFPAFLVASEFGGVEFYLMLSSGKVIALHHDASFFEVAREVRDQVGENPVEFEKTFAKQGSVHTIDQLLAFQNAFAGLRKENLDEIPPESLIPRLADAFGWTIQELAAVLDELPMEFLYWDVMEHEDVLKVLIEKEKQNT
jgi:hypothetical protein